MSPGECRAGLVFPPPPMWGFTSSQGELGSGGWVWVAAWPQGGEPLSGSCSPGETPVLASVLLIPSSKMPQKSSGEKPNINSSALTILRVVFL